MKHNTASLQTSRHPQKPAFHLLWWKTQATGPIGSRVFFHSIFGYIVYYPYSTTLLKAIYQWKLKGSSQSLMHFTGCQIMKWCVSWPCNMEVNFNLKVALKSWGMKIHESNMNYMKTNLSLFLCELFLSSTHGSLLQERRLEIEIVPRGYKSNISGASLLQEVYFTFPNLFLVTFKSYFNQSQPYESCHFIMSHPVSLKLGRLGNNNLLINALSLFPPL